MFAERALVMKLIGEEGLDLAVIPIGDNYTMGPADALLAVKLLTPKVVIPIHFSTLGLINQDAADWAARVAGSSAISHSVCYIHFLPPFPTSSLASTTQ